MNAEAEKLSQSIDANKQLLVIAQNRERKKLLGFFRNAGFSATGVSTYDEAFAQVEAKGTPNLAVLVLQTAGPDSFLKARTLSRNGEVPVVVLSRIDDVEVVSRAIAEFADDYMRIPYSGAELLARVRRVLSRTAQSCAAVSPMRVRVSDKLHVDFANGDTFINGHRVLLTPIEVRIVKVLHDWRGQIVPYDSMTTLIWGSANQQLLNTLWVHIRRLREKIEPDPQLPSRILTVRGIGYCLSNRLDEDPSYSIAESVVESVFDV